MLSFKSGPRIKTGLSFLFDRVVPLLCVAVLCAILIAAQTPAAQAQTRLPGAATTTGSEPAIELPADLSPEMVDALMARLTDAEIRALLRDWSIF